MRMMRVCIISSRHSAPVHPLSGCAAALTQNSRGTYGFRRNQKETCYVRTVTKLHLVSSRQKLNNPFPALTLMSSISILLIFFILTVAKILTTKIVKPQNCTETNRWLCYPGRYVILEWRMVCGMKCSRCC